jgi:hypothetical protein
LPGLKNFVADFLSRPFLSQLVGNTLDAAVEPINFEEMAAEQARCPETQRLRGVSSLKIGSCLEGQYDLLGNTSTGVIHPIIPIPFRKNVFLSIHNIAHPGRLASRRMLSSKLVWQRCHGLVPRLPGLQAVKGPPPRPSPAIKISNSAITFFSHQS